MSDEQSFQMTADEAARYIGMSVSWLWLPIPPTAGTTAKRRPKFCWVCAKRFRGAPQAKRCPACRAKPGREKRISVRRWPDTFSCRRGAA